MRISKLIVCVFIATTVIFQNAHAQNWKLNEKESFIIFIAKNLGMNVSGKISGMKVTGGYNDENLFLSISSYEDLNTETYNKVEDQIQQAGEKYVGKGKMPHVELIMTHQ